MNDPRRRRRLAAAYGLSFIVHGLAILLFALVSIDIVGGSTEIVSPADVVVVRDEVVSTEPPTAAPVRPSTAEQSEKSVRASKSASVSRLAPASNPSASGRPALVSGRNSQSATGAPRPEIARNVANAERQSAHVGEPDAAVVVPSALPARPAEPLSSVTQAPASTGSITPPEPLTRVPVTQPTPLPAIVPTAAPTYAATAIPTGAAAANGSTNGGTDVATQTPRATVTLAPAAEPTQIETAAPTPAPTAILTAAPTFMPTTTPTVAPMRESTAAHTIAPKSLPTSAAIVLPTAVPIATPSAALTAAPTSVPTRVPTTSPTLEGTAEPLRAPTVLPSREPVAQATTTPAVPSTAAPVSISAPAPTRAGALLAQRGPAVHPARKPSSVSTNPGVGATPQKVAPRGIDEGRNASSGNSSTRGGGASIPGSSPSAPAAAVPATSSLNERLKRLSAGGDVDYRPKRVAIGDAQTVFDAAMTAYEQRFAPPPEILGRTFGFIYEQRKASQPDSLAYVYDTYSIGPIKMCKAWKIIEHPYQSVHEVGAVARSAGIGGGVATNANSPDVRHDSGGDAEVQRVDFPCTYKSYTAVPKGSLKRPLPLHPDLLTPPPAALTLPHGIVAPTPSSPAPSLAPL